MEAIAASSWTSLCLDGVAGLVHGFEIRLAARPGASREEGRRRVAEHLAAVGRTLFMKQVHGTELLVAPWEGAPEADAALSSVAGLLIAVETADCLPIILVEPHARLAAVVHAGWRGSAAGVAAHAVERLVVAGGERRSLHAVLGPCIGACCYEVGEELRVAFGAESSAFFRDGTGPRPHLDLREANRFQLTAAGVPVEQIADVSACTFCHPARLPSYRRDGRDCGRIVSYVGWRRSVHA